MNGMILSSPGCMVLFGVAFILTAVTRFLNRFRILSAILAGACATFGIITALVLGATYEELLVAVLCLALVGLPEFRGKSK